MNRLNKIVKWHAEEDNMPIVAFTRYNPAGIRFQHTYQRPSPGSLVRLWATLRNMGIPVRKDAWGGYETL